ncbi:MAG: hypothetical protein R6U27_02480 [Desulfobacterales bacterium]
MSYIMCVTETGAAMIFISYDPSQASFLSRSDRADDRQKSPVHVRHEYLFR